VSEKPLVDVLFLKRQPRLLQAQKHGLPHEALPNMDAKYPRCTK
jgi:hypothetical protein